MFYLKHTSIFFFNKYVHHLCKRKKKNWVTHTKCSTQHDRHCLHCGNLMINKRMIISNKR